MSFFRLNKRDIAVTGCFAIGQTDYCNLEKEVVDAVDVFLSGEKILGRVAKFYRALVNDKLLFSEEYGRVTVTNSHTVIFKRHGKEEFGSILFFIIVYSKVLAIIKLFTAATIVPPDNYMKKWIVPVIDVGTIDCIPVNCIVCKSFCCKLTSNIHYD